MAYLSPPSHNPGDLITASDWNAYIRDNWQSLSGLIAYVNSASPLSGWSEFTTARGLFILGLVSGGTLATAVGTPLTNQQNVTHTHTVTLVDSSQHVVPSLVGGDPYLPQGQPTGTASAGSIGIPYIQLLCISKD